MDPTDVDRRTVLRTVGVAALASGAVPTVTARKGGLKRELAEVRSATAEYNDPANAVEDGYHPEPEPICGMGYHYGNFGLVGTVDRTVPQVLAYGEDDDGNRILGAVEYLVPKMGEYSEDPPDLFEHDEGEETWGILNIPEEAPPPFTELWALHVWVHTHNPEGVFHHTNPRKQFCPEGAGGH